jgi:hypothetical protein
VALTVVPNTTGHGDAITHSTFGVCSKCNNQAVRLIGTVPHCEQCAFALLEPLRLKWGVTVIRRTTERHGFRECGTCGATWVGSEFDCQWCERRAKWLHEDRRKRLLWPDNPGAMWNLHLAKAIVDETVTAHEAKQALARIANAG